MIELHVTKASYSIPVSFDEDGTPVLKGERMVEVRPGVWVTPLAAALEAWLAGHMSPDVDVGPDPDEQGDDRQHQHGDPQDSHGGAPAQQKQDHYPQIPNWPRAGTASRPVWPVGCPCGWTGSAPSKREARKLWRAAHAKADAR